MRAICNTYLMCLATLCALCAIIGLPGCGASNAAGTPAHPTTVVLVHGAWADGSSWNKVIAVLQQRGLAVVAVQLPRASLAGDAAVVARVVAAQAGQVVLVGHSYGGAVITEAGSAAKVAALVYVSAFAPGDGQSANDLASPFPAPAWQAGLIVDNGWISLSAATVAGSFAPDLAPAEAAQLAATQGPIFHQVLDDKITTAAWKSKPNWWVYGSADQIIPAGLQQAEAARLGARATVISGASHVALLSHPAEVAAVILDAVTSVGGL